MTNFYNDPLNPPLDQDDDQDNDLVYEGEVVIESTEGNIDSD
jgi:hypothetical protein